MTKLDIIIPHYKEPWEVGEKLFTMIRLQRGIDFGEVRVTLVNDGGHRIEDERLAGFPCEIRQIDIPHSGVSAARNAGMDAADADWIMFCDFDDTFAGVYALRDALNVLPADGYDMLWAHMIVEDRVDGHDNIYFTPEIQRFVFTHAKLYRRQFLIDSGIRFTEGMPFQEDSEFNARIIARTPHERIGEITSPCPMYVWIRRQNSVSQSGRDDEANYYHFLRNLTITEDNRAHRSPEHYRGMVTRTVWDTWFMICGRKISDGMKKRILDRFQPWIMQHREAFLGVPEDILKKIREVSRLELDDPGGNVPDDPAILTAWIDTMIERGKRTDGNVHDKPEPEDAGRVG